VEALEKDGAKPNRQSDGLGPKACQRTWRNAETNKANLSANKTVKYKIFLKEKLYPLHTPHHARD
jgi:hypothetical protein